MSCNKYDRGMLRIQCLCSQKELTNLAQPLLDSLPQAAKEGSPKSEYVGGDFRLATLIPRCLTICIPACTL